MDSFVLIGILAFLSAQTPAPLPPPENAQALEVPSSVDGTAQPCYFIPATGAEPRPLLVALHPWSHAYNTSREIEPLREQAVARNWHCLQPHFRGPNKNPDACASTKARKDVLDAVDYVVKHYPVDTNRIYLAGVSGGGHMALVMAAHAPERWAAVSAWAAITDLAAWHGETKSLGRLYWQDIESCCGGAPGSSPEVDRELRFRSSLFHISVAKELPLDIATGIHDGHTGSVPVHHTVDVFNAVAKEWKAQPVGSEELARLSARQPLIKQEEQDPTFGRTIYLRRYAGPSRVTIFEGGHEIIAQAACEWLAQHAR